MTSSELDQRRRAVAAEPTRSDLVVALGSALYAENDFEEAELVFKRALALRHDDPEAAEGLAKVVLAGARYVEAESLLDLALTHGLPRSAAVITMLGICRAFGGDAAGAVALLEEAIAQDPDYEPAYGGLARLYYDTKDVPACLRVTNTALLKFPANVPCLELRAQARLLSLDLVGAEQDADTALVLDPRSIDALLCKAALRTAHQDMQGGMLWLREAYGVDPESVDVLNALGGAFMVQQQINEAEACHVRASEIDPSNAQAHEGLASVALARQRWDKGIEEASVAIDLGAEGPIVHFILGSCLAHVGRRAEGQAELEGVVAIVPSHAPALVALAEIEILGESTREEGRRHALAALKVAPDGQIAERANRVLGRWN